MKKENYIKPMMKEMLVEPIQMIALSARMRDDRDVDYSSNLSNRQHGSWGDLWNGE